MKKIFFVSSLLFFVYSCSFSKTKEDEIEQLETYVESIKQNEAKLSPEVIEEYDHDIEEFKDQIAEFDKEITRKDERKINEALGKYQAIKLKFYAKQFKDDALDAFQQGTSMVKELMPDSAEVEEAIQKTEGFLKELTK